MSRTALAFTAHPDDAEICLGGTLAALADHGWDVHIVVASVPDHRDRRLAEVQRGADVLGARAHVLEHDGHWQVEDLTAYQLVREFDRHVRRLAPQRVFTHWLGDTHQDHVLVARAAISAMRGSHADLFMCEQPNQYAPSASPFPVDTYVDVSAQFERRLRAVACHLSQAAAEKYTEQLTARARYHGDRIGCRYAEAFSCVVQRMELS
ncbi:PIG-L deacetylase family protein [Kitasatospora viridis]|uniref:LmbE family N-acetylglucosaminyl deacetylase n=1 Tax=Kitasatospora viridis TaxID=281105 RepID=A0A561T6C7_9ACTN|nr:PIG-L family deacetylase [Kitasatospora viridis]TWF82664.1 LmbE family N-acetylglucosaminyl deacetylase [Kitasatospora viridis]